MMNATWPYFHFRFGSSQFWRLERWCRRAENALYWILSCLHFAKFFWDDIFRMAPKEPSSCLLNTRITFAVIGLVLGVSIFFCFGFAYDNWDTAAFGLVSGKLHFKFKVHHPFWAILTWFVVNKKHVTSNRHNVIWWSSCVFQLFVPLIKWQVPASRPIVY